MNTGEFFARLVAHPASKAAILGERRTLDYAALRAETLRLSTQLRERGARVLGTLLDNDPAWVVADLAALHAGIVHVPIPAFFTWQQTAFVLDAAGVDTVLAHAAPPGFESSACDAAGARLMLGSRSAPSVAIIDGTAKITFTSGTTGAPKGVCLSAAAMLAVAGGLSCATSALAIGRHLCALPLAVLLENVAGVYAPLLAGATIVVLPVRNTGLEGSSHFDPSRLDSATRDQAADSVIVLPQMLRAWSAWRGGVGTTGASGLRFIAVGGAAVGSATLESARSVGLPAFEGYGLSEGASVQTLNLPGADRPGSVGRALPHAQIRVAADGEIEIAGSVMLGYLGQPVDGRRWWPTGDLGAIDADGYVHVRGRKKHVLITAFGRNVSPEWVESVLESQPEIARAVVQGDGKPALEAVLWPARDAVTDGALARAIRAANARLPDYARVRRFVRAHVPFTSAADACTPNGRPLRHAIEAMHAADFAAAPRESDVVL